jgi:two-component system chemotaxis response regulator CheB
MGTNCGPRRVVVVEDSPTVAFQLAALLAEAGFEVAGQAAGVAEAERLVRDERPDLVLSDIELADGNGIELARRVLLERGLPIVLITARDHRNPELIFRALQAGALEVLPKPPARTSAAFAAYVRRFETTLSTLVGVPVVRRRSRPSPAPPSVTRDVAPPRLPAAAPIVALGASTGGPVVVGDLVKSLVGRRLSFAVVAQHIVPDFTESFRAWLSEHSGLKVQMARDGECPEAGGIYTIPGGSHLEVTPEGFFRLVPGPALDAPHVPSIDTLFASLARYRPRDTLAVLLTGMGQDGARGLLALRQAGALTVAQEPASAAVDSMPRAALEREAALRVLTPPEIAALLDQLPAKEPIPSGGRAALEERRLSRRSALDRPACLIADGGTHHARMTSLSRMGARLETDRALAVGTPVRMVLELAAPEATLELRGQVVRTDTIGAARAVGVMFAPLSLAALAGIDAILASAAPPDEAQRAR